MPVACPGGKPPSEQLKWIEPDEGVVSGVVKLEVEVPGAPFVGFVVRHLSDTEFPASSGWRQVGTVLNPSAQGRASVEWNTEGGSFRPTAGGEPVAVVAVACAAVGVPVVDGVRFLDVRDGDTHDSTGVDRPLPTLDPEAIAAARTAACAFSPSLLPARPAVPVLLSRLGVDLAPLAAEPCNASTPSVQSVWQLGPISLNGVQHLVAYSCDVRSGTAGSLEFALGEEFREFDVTVGLADDSPSVRRRVRFEIIGDGRYLTESHTIGFGETLDLKVDVAGILRLTLRITELTYADAEDSSARAVWANPTLIPV